MADNEIGATTGTCSGKGQIIRKNGEVVDFIVTTDPLTPEQDEWAKSNLKKTEE